LQKIKERTSQNEGAETSRIIFENHKGIFPANESGVRYGGKSEPGTNQAAFKRF
jgi:hypothetical protein